MSAISISGKDIILLWTRYIIALTPCTPPGCAAQLKAAPFCESRTPSYESVATGSGASVMTVSVCEGGGVDLSSLVPDIGHDKQVDSSCSDLRIFTISHSNSFMICLPYMVRESTSVVRVDGPLPNL